MDVAEAYGLYIEEGSVVGREIENTVFVLFKKK